jgi:hypothetical protein
MAEIEFVKRYGAATFDGSEAAREKYIGLLLHRCRNSAEGPSCSKLVRLPIRGGEVFVSADPRSSAANGIQADLNAAANIGLKALTDPDWEGAWWYVPVKSKDGTVDSTDFAGCGLFGETLKLLEVTESDSAGKQMQRKSREKTNAWSDVSAESFAGRRYGWVSTMAYWNGVEKRVVKGLAAQSALALDGVDQ